MPSKEIHAFCGARESRAPDMEKPTVRKTLTVATRSKSDSSSIRRRGNTRTVIKKYRSDKTRRRSLDIAGITRRMTWKSRRV